MEAVAKLRARRREVFVPLEHRPGEGHPRAFEFFRVVPRSISYDNSKVAAGKIIGSREIVASYVRQNLSLTYTYSMRYFNGLNLSPLQVKGENRPLLLPVFRPGYRLKSDKSQS